MACSSLSLCNKLKHRIPCQCDIVALVVQENISKKCDGILLLYDKLLVCKHTDMGDERPPGPSEEPEDQDPEETTIETEVQEPPAPEEEEIDPRKLLTPEQVEQLKELFILLDVQGKGKLPVKQIGTALRMLGLNPRQHQILQHIRQIDPTGKGFTDFQGFLLPIAQRIEEVSESQEEIVEAFRALDEEGSGFLQADRLVDLLTTLGERLEDFEIESLVKTADIQGDGNINYEEFVERMMGVPKKQESKKEGKKKGKKK